MSNLGPWLPARLAATLAAATVLAAPALAQANPLPRDSTARVERLAAGVYTIIHDDGVLVEDATYLLSRAPADIALIRALSDKPVRYLVNTRSNSTTSGSRCRRGPALRWTPSGITS